MSSGAAAAMVTEAENDTGAVVSLEDGDVKTLGLVLEDRTMQLKSLEFQVSRKESEVRIAREERAVMQQMHTINQMAMRKIAVNDGAEREGRLRISDESLAQIVELENKIKVESKRTQELQKQADVVQKRTEAVEGEITAKQNQIALVKDVTGWDRFESSSRGFVNHENRFKEHQKILADLEEQQQTLKIMTTKLSTKIEKVTTELERRRDLDEEFSKAETMLKMRTQELDELVEKKKSLQRITQRKEKMLSHMDRKDEHKQIKQLEGEKRVLHTELGKHMEAVKTNEKSVVAQDVRLRQLEVRLDAINNFLKKTFDAVGDDQWGAEAPEWFEDGHDAVPVDRFNELQQELAQHRNTITQRDQKLEELDAQIESMEKKSQIIIHAMSSRLNNARQEREEQDRTYNVLSGHIAVMRAEFEEEQQRLEDEYARLQQMEAMRK